MENKVSENKVSEFLVSTCRMKKEFNLNDNTFLLLTGSSYLGMSYTKIPCGSQAEFYIEPINTCIDDFDILLAVNSFLALDCDFQILEGVGDLRDVILCCKLESYEQNKSFVRLRDPTFGAYDWKSEEYKFINIPLMSFMQRDSSQSPTYCLRLFEQNAVFSGKFTELNSLVLNWIAAVGPALKRTTTNLNEKSDSVLSIFCPNWPLVAEKWPKRRRYSGWPNSETINKVVRDGCDVVAVTHRDMQAEINQWRLSFSRAEVTLIKSWTKTQQIVYHLLRFFAKREIIRKNCSKKEEVVCTYHLKTLMLWSCEEESREWWDTLSVVAICCNLCGKLCECLKHKSCCPNYFIPEANLLDHELDSQVLQQTIKKLDHYRNVEKMSQWFAAHYILPAYQKLCNENETFLTEEKVETCITSVYDRNEKRKLGDLDKNIFLCAFSCFHFISYPHGFLYTSKQIFKATEHCNHFLDTTVISKMQETLSHYIKAFTLFYMSQSILSNTLQCDVEALSEIWIYILRQSYFVENSYVMHPLSVCDKSMVYFNHAEQMMKHLAFAYSNNESYFAIMVAMICLHESLGCNDTSSNITQTASRIYLAALLYYIGHRQCTVDLCSAVETSSKESVRNVRNLKVNSLLFVDDLATIAGFLLLRRKILRTQSKEISFLSLKLFVHYLLILCNPKELDIKQAPRMELSFEADYCLASMMRYKTLLCTDKKTNKTLVYSEHTEDTEIALPGKTDIAYAMARISNEFMTRFYTSLSEEFGTKFNLGPCYEALSLYLCRRYEDVIFMCEKLLEESEDDSELEEFLFLNINVSKCFMAYFDEDIQALVGLQSLVLHLSSMQKDFLEDSLDDFDEGLTRKRIPCIDRLFESLDANKSFWVTFNPILRKQFLGNYLKLRCLLDLEFTRFEVISAFQCLKSRFPFENILVHFMHEKIIRYCRSTAAKKALV